jgi:hypothetical protein
LRMLVRTFEGMSIRLVASGSPIYKIYDYKTENIFGKNGQKIDASWKTINVDKKLTTIHDQQNAIKRIGYAKKNQLCTFLACELCTEGTRAVWFKYISTTCQNNLLREWFNESTTLRNLLYCIELPWGLFHSRQEILAHL